MGGPALEARLTSPPFGRYRALAERGQTGGVEYDSEGKTVVGQPIHWQYALIWSPEAKSPRVTLYRISSAGHRFLWASVPGPELIETPDVDRVLQELYTGLLELMEATC